MEIYKDAYYRQINRAPVMLRVFRFHYIILIVPADELH